MLLGRESKAIRELSLCAIRFGRVIQPCGEGDSAESSARLRFIGRGGGLLTAGGHVDCSELGMIGFAG